LFLLLATGCSKAPDADLQYIGDARSLAAEWALINTLAGEGKLSASYTTSMHHWLREGLRRDASSLTRRNAPYAMDMKGLLKLPDDAPAAELKRFADKLKRTEDSLESA
jgi:hypothetical protein